MKRILYSSLLLIITLFVSKKAFAQNGSFALSSSTICFNPAPGSMTVGVAITSTIAGSASYTWTAVSPAGPGCSNYSVLPIAVNGTAAIITVPCCGNYQINMNGYSQGGIPIPNPPAMVLTVECPSNGSIAIPSQTICRGNSTNITALGATNYSWNISSSGGGGTSNVNPLSVSPTVNATYTVFPTTAAGCTLNPLTATVAVQAASINVSPASITVCDGAPVTLSSTISAISGTNVAAGTVTTGIQWFSPPAGAVISNTRVVTTTVTAGTYSAVLTHTGSAGTCTIQGTVLVNTVTAMSLTIAASAQSICPGANITLSGSTGTVPTAASGYTWTAIPAMFPASFVGNPITRSPTVATVYSVNASYYGCTATASVQVGMASITPTISSSVGFSCPNKSLSITANGAITYTFYTQTSFTNVIATAQNTINTVTHSPSLAQLNFPIQYCVTGYSFGCTGTTCTNVGLYVITPTLTSLSGPSVCPGTSLTLSSTGGAGTNYTFTAFPGSFGPLVTVGVNGPSNTRPYTPPGANLGNYPLSFTVAVDSAGCKGNSTLSVGIMTIFPTVTSTGSLGVCSGTSYTLTASGGAGTNYTWTVPPTPTNPATISGNQVVHSSTLLGITYTVAVDSAGCFGDAQYTVNQYSISPTFSLSPNSGSICLGSQASFTVSGGASTQYTFIAPYNISPPTPGSIIATTDATVNNVSVSPPATSSLFPLTYSVVIDSAGCNVTSTLSIGLFSISPLNLSLTANSASYCPNSNMTLTAIPINSLSAYNYTFIAPPNISYTTAASNTISNISSPATPTDFPATYTVVADSVDIYGAHCPVTNTLQIGLHTLQNFALIANPASVCAGMPTTLIAISGVANTSSYQCTFIPISPASTVVSGPSFTTSAVFNPTINTVYSLVVDSAGCQTPTVPPITTVVNINAPTSFTPIASSNSVCAGLPSTINIAGGVPTNTYTWVSPLFTGTLTVGAIPSTSAVSNPTSNSIYTISAIDDLGCVSTETVEVDIDPAAHITLTLSSSGTTICPGQSVTLTAVADINPSTFTWSPATGLNATSGASVVANPQLTTVYTATADNGYGCVGNENYTVQVAPPPTPTVIASANAVCAGFSSTLTAFGALSFTWTGTTFSGSIAQQSISVPPGTYSLTASNGGSCIDSSYTFTVTLAPNLVITTSQTSNTTCITTNYPKLSKPVTLTANGAATYAWSAYDPATVTYSLGPQTIVRPHATTCYTVTGATSICSGSAIVCVTVIPQFTMAVTPPLPAMCLGDSLKLSIVNISTLAVGPPSQFSYEWHDPNNYISVVNPLASTVIATPNSTSTYSVEVRDSRACISVPRLVTVTVFPQPITAIAIPTINSVPTNTVCFVGDNPGPPDNVITLTGVNANVGLQFGIVPTYTWTSPYTQSSILTPPNNNVITVSAPNRLPAVVVYTLQSGYNGIPGCRVFDTVSVRVIDCRPVSAITHSLMFSTAEKNDTICSRQCITFINQTDTAAGGPQEFEWFFPNGSPATSTLSNPTVCYNLPGKYNVILSVKNPYPIADGGSNITGGQINYVKVVDIPNVTIVSPGQLASDTIIKFGQTVSLTGANALSYIWSPAYNISSLTNNQVIVNPFKTTQYILKGYNSQGCYSTDTINVHVIEDCGEMYVPNAFSPNNDGHNDKLYVRGLCLQTLTFMVFNRWGEKVFETADQNVGWDGTFRGEDINTGIYVYRLEGKTYDGKGFSAKGNITLIR